MSSTRYKNAIISFVQNSSILTSNAFMRMNRNFSNYVWWKLLHYEIILSLILRGCTLSLSRTLNGCLSQTFVRKETSVTQLQKTYCLKQIKENALRYTHHS